MAGIGWSEIKEIVQNLEPNVQLLLKPETFNELIKISTIRWREDGIFILERKDEFQIWLEIDYWRGYFAPKDQKNLLSIDMISDAKKRLPIYHSPTVCNANTKETIL